MVKHLDFGGTTKKTKSFTAEYKMSLFQQWYNLGRITGKKLYPIIREDESGTKPALSTLDFWIHNDFKAQADLMDEQVRTEMEKRLVQAKVEMLSRHAQLGKEMQIAALDKIRQLSEKKDLSEAGSLRLLEFAVKLERESLGIPDMLAKIMKKSDDEILEEIQVIMKSSNLTLEANVDDELSDL